jgi:DNA repair exonuclease SbcCD ATPase subunit
MDYPKEHIKSDGRKLVSGGPRDLQRKQQMIYTTLPDVGLIEGLKKQIEELKEISKSKQSGNLYTAEEVDEELRKAVEAAVKETTLALKKNTQMVNQEIEPVLQKYKVQIVELQKNNDDLIRNHSSIIDQNSEMKIKIDKLEEELKEVIELKKQIAVLEQTLIGKAELIDTLKSRPVVVGSTEVEDPDRPKMEQIFVDPLEKDAGDGLKPNINIETTKLDLSPQKEEMDDKVNKLRGLLGKLPTRKF